LNPKSVLHGQNQLSYKSGSVELFAIERTSATSDLQRRMIYRDLKTSEYDLLKEFLYNAIYIPEGVDPPGKEIVEQPELALYYEGFGTGKADRCIVAEDAGKVVGAVWTRIMDDYGHVDDDTPSFAISLLNDYRSKGIGTQLMMKMLLRLKENGFEKASLAVQKANYAVHLYEKVGFKVNNENAEEYIMICDLRQSVHEEKGPVALLAPRFYFLRFKAPHCWGLFQHIPY